MLFLRALDFYILILRKKKRERYFYDKGIGDSCFDTSEGLRIDFLVEPQLTKTRLNRNYGVSGTKFSSPRRRKHSLSRSLRQRRAPFSIILTEKGSSDNLLSLMKILFRFLSLLRIRCWIQKPWKYVNSSLRFARNWVNLTILIDFNVF